jgi:hypothetical protein
MGKGVHGQGKTFRDRGPATTDAADLLDDFVGGAGEGHEIDEAVRIPTSNFTGGREGASSPGSPESRTEW